MGIIGDKALEVKRFCLCGINMGCLWGIGALAELPFAAGILLIDDELLDAGTRTGILEGVRLIADAFLENWHFDL